MNRGLNKWANMLFQGMDLLLGHLSWFSLSTMSKRNGLMLLYILTYDYISTKSSKSETDEHLKY